MEFQTTVEMIAAIRERKDAGTKQAGPVWLSLYCAP
jgi:hypothetical protein